MTKSFLDPPRNQEPLMSSGNWQPWLPWAGDAGDRFCSFLLLLGSLDPPSSARQSSRQRVTSLMLVITILLTSQLTASLSSREYKSNHLVITFLMFSSFHKLTYAFNTSELIRSKHLLDAAEASSDHERRGDCPWLVYYIIGHWTSPQPHNFCVFYARKASLYNGLLICKPNTVVKLQVTTIIIYWQVSSTPQLFTGSTGSMRLRLVSVHHSLRQPGLWPGSWQPIRGQDGRALTNQRPGLVTVKHRNPAPEARASGHSRGWRLLRIWATDKRGATWGIMGTQDVASTFVIITNKLTKKLDKSIVLVSSEIWASSKSQIEASK